MLLTPSGDPLRRVLTTETARRCGYSPARIETELRTGRWTALRRGVYLTRPELPTRGDWVSVGLAVAGRDAAVSGWDAVRAYGLGSPRAPVDDVLVLAATGSHRSCDRIRIRPSRRSLDVRRLPIPDAGRVPVAGPARAVADTALVYRWNRPVRALVTAVVQAGLCTVDELAVELETGPQNGSAHLRRALEDVRGGAASIAEAEWADAMRASVLPPFELNVPILDPGGRHIATADVLWRALRAVLEVDSRQHHFLEPAWRKTMTRHNGLTRLGLAVTHYPPAELSGRTAQVIGEVETWLRGRARELGVPYPPAAGAGVGVGAGEPFRLTRLPA